VWDASNVHALTFTRGAVHIGIRGARNIGIDYGELVRIATSLA
jgi:hypothetical protein